MKKTKAICIRFLEEDLKNLRKAARRSSLLEDKDISYTDIIRDLVKKYISGLNNKEIIKNDREKRMP